MNTQRNLKSIAAILITVLLFFSCKQKEEQPVEDHSLHNMPGMEMNNGNMQQDSASHSHKDISLNDILKPTNGFILSDLPMTSLQYGVENMNLESYGVVSYDERSTAVVSSRVSGRIEKLYVKHRFENVAKGQKLMDIYSPELVTAQQELLFILNNDSQNSSLIESAKQKLQLLGMSETQLNEIIQQKKVTNTVTVYSNHTGHVHEALDQSSMNNSMNSMNENASITQPLPLKEGMYVQKGEALFTIYNPDKAWVVMNLFPEQQLFIRKGDSVEIVPGADAAKSFAAKIDFIEPLYREGNKTLSARIYFNNASLMLPISSRVKVMMKNKSINGEWLPSSSIVSLGKDEVTFAKFDGGFIPKKIETGISANDKAQIISGLTEKDSVVINAQYLMDSESFIKTKQ